MGLGSSSSAWDICSFDFCLLDARIFTSGLGVFSITWTGCMLQGALLFFNDERLIKVKVFMEQFVLNGTQIIFEVRSWNTLVCSTLVNWRFFDKCGCSWSHLFSFVWHDKSDFSELLRELAEKRLVSITEKLTLPIQPAAACY